MIPKMPRKIPKAARARQTGPKGSNAKSGERRADIVDALRRRIIEKGYAQTSLADIATAAGISPSHLLYYFPNKEAVLEELCDQVLDRLYQTVNATRNESAEERIHLLVSNVFIARS